MITWRDSHNSEEIKRIFHDWIDVPPFSSKEVEDIFIFYTLPNTHQGYLLNFPQFLDSSTNTKRYFAALSTFKIYWRTELARMGNNEFPGRLSLSLIMLAWTPNAVCRRVGETYLWYLIFEEITTNIYICYWLLQIRNQSTNYPSRTGICLQSTSCCRGSKWHRHT